MAHTDTKLAAIQTKVAAGQRLTSIPVNPDDSKAIVTQIKSFTDAALQRKLTYASLNNITVALTEDEMKSLLADINRNSR